MKAVMTVHIATEFSKFPAGRYRMDGPDSGQRLREELLAPKLRTAANLDRKLVVILDGTLWFGSAFLEEAFGGLVRAESFTLQQLETVLKLQSSDLMLEHEIWGYIYDAQQKQSKTESALPMSRKVSHVQLDPPPHVPMAAARNYLLKQEHSQRCVSGLVHEAKGCTCGLSEALLDVGLTVEEINAAADEHRLSRFLPPHRQK